LPVELHAVPGFAQNVCVERSATLLFRAGHRNCNISAVSTGRMLNAYHASLRQYVM
jgi:hypothetical protein